MLSGSITEANKAKQPKKQHLLFITCADQVEVM